MTHMNHKSKEKEAKKNRTPSEVLRPFPCYCRRRLIAGPRGRAKEPSPESGRGIGEPELGEAIRWKEALLSFESIFQFLIFSFFPLISLAKFSLDLDRV